MIRITLLTLLIAFLSVYAWKDWFRASCWLVLLMAVFQHPDMPKAAFGIAGLNHWNFLFLNVFCSWLANRKKENLSWEMPVHLNILLFFYGVFIFVGVFRYLNDHSGVEQYIDAIGGAQQGNISAINEYLINCLKWIIPGLIIFDGCRDRKQYNYAVMALLFFFVFLGVQVIKAMKLGSLTIGGDLLQQKALKVISSNVGYHRVNISMMMSGAFWAIFCLKELVNRKCYCLLILPSCLIVFLSMGLTGGRTGYATWLILAMFFCLFKWKKYLLVAPLVFLVVIAFAPSTVERFTQGVTVAESEIGEQQVEFESTESMDMRTITSGRIIAWPLVLDSIADAPFLGHGRESMVNLGITLQIMQRYGDGETFPHPHNAYLQWVQDNGFIGAIPVFLFFMLMITYAWKLFRDDSKSIYVVTGGMSLALILAFLIASSGSQTFYPREGAVALWVIIGLLIRTHIERKKIISGEKSNLIEP